MITHPDTECTGRFFEVMLRFNSGDSYHYLLCTKCERAWIEKPFLQYPYFVRHFPVVDIQPDIYVVGVMARIVSPKLIFWQG